MFSVRWVLDRHELVAGDTPIKSRKGLPAIARLAEPFVTESNLQGWISALGEAL
jgi:hypothetical protein